MKTFENKFNPYNDLFNTKEGWSEFLKLSISFWIDKRILQVAVSSILEEEELLINLGKGKKFYQFQRYDSGILAFPKDKIGDSIPITDQIYQFHINEFLKYLAIENGFNVSDEELSEGDYVIGYLSIGGKRIIWIYSFSVEGFQRYKTKPYFESLNQNQDFILLSDYTGNSPNIVDDNLDYVPLPCDSQNFKVDFHKFIKRKSGITSDEARDHLKDRITFFIDNTLEQIYYTNKLVNIGGNTQIYKFFIFLLKNPSYSHPLVQVVKTEQGVNLSNISSNQELLSRGRSFKQYIKRGLKKIASNDDIDKILPDTKPGNQKHIKLHLLKKDIFFF